MGLLARSSAAPQTSEAAPHGAGPHFAGQANTGQRGANPASETPTWESWDQGRLVVRSRFSPILQAHGLMTCRSLLDYEGGVVARRVHTRETRQISLNGPSGPVHLFLKRHGRPAWRDRLLPWLHGGRPIHGARNEWEAILAFHEAGLPTMIPVAFGALGPESLLITEALPARCNLLELIGGRDTAQPYSSQAISAAAPRALRGLIERIAAIARTMHAAGFHHQDFYLNHLLLCGSIAEPDIRVIDLGRVRHQARLALRWIVKDLAQLNFSAGRLSTQTRLRFLRLYLDRPFQPADRRLVRRIAAKSRRIAAHTRKHSL